MNHDITLWLYKHTNTILNFTSSLCVTRMALRKYEMSSLSVQMVEKIIFDSAMRCWHVARKQWCNFLFFTAGGMKHQYIANMAGTSRMQINFERLLHVCEKQAASDHEDHWRLQKVGFWWMIDIIPFMVVFNTNNWGSLILEVIQSESLAS